jgi:hypothetical protein
VEGVDGLTATDTGTVPAGTASGPAEFGLVRAVTTLVPPA